jgi:hypothetical protein
LDLEGESKRENVIVFSNLIYSTGIKGREQGRGKIKHSMMTRSIDDVMVNLIPSILSWSHIGFCISFIRKKHLLLLLSMGIFYVGRTQCRRLPALCGVWGRVSLSAKPYPHNMQRLVFSTLDLVKPKLRNNIGACCVLMIV